MQPIRSSRSIAINSPPWRARQAPRLQPRRPSNNRPPRISVRPPHAVRMPISSHGSLQPDHQTRFSIHPPDTHSQPRSSQLVDAEVLGHPMHVQEAQDKQHHGHQADERKDDQDKPGHAVKRRGLPMTPTPGPRKHRERSRRHTNTDLTAPRRPGQTPRRFSRRRQTGQQKTARTASADRVTRTNSPHRDPPAPEQPSPTQAPRCLPK